MDTSEKMGDLQAQQQQTNGGTSKQIVHVRGDSETELDLLFSVLNSRDQKPPTRSFRDMNLPLSFFRPPDPKPAGCHSREGSLDGAGVQYTGGTSHPSHGGPMASMPNVFHSRSHSSPAQLPLSLSVAPQMPSGQQQHMKHESADAGGVDGGLHHQQSSWTNGTLAQNVSNKFFMSAAKGVWPQQQQVADSHGKGRTTSVASSPNKQTGGGVLLQNGQNGHQGAPAVVVPPSSHNLGPLPHGWEQGVTPEGDIYFINHIEKTTSWFDPRIPKHLQKSVPVKATSIRGSGSIVGTAVQHKQPAQPNHVVAATPVAVTSPQRPPSGAVSSLQSVVVNRPPVVSSVSHPSHEQLLRHELQKLQKEKERLRREQEEAVRREKLLMNELAKMKQLQAVSISSSSTAPAANAGTVSGSGGEHSSSSSQMMMMQQMVNSGVDPFLGQSVVPGATAPSSIESHSVQTTVTADAGHASAGATGFSLVRNPEEFFGSIDNMDTNDVHKTTGASRVQQQQQQPSNMSGLQQCMPAIDVPLLADSSDQLGMDSDDLVPTLTDDITMDVQMMENIIQYI